jgi:maltose O-acetyltransferase
MNSPLKDKHGQPLAWAQVAPKGVNRLKSYYTDFTVALLWLFGYVPSHLFRRQLFRVAGIKMGRQATIHIGARFYQPHNISIGEGTIIGDHATLDGRAKLSIGNHVDIASQVMIYNSQHDINDQWFSPIEKPVHIGDHVFIGPRAIILPGVTIGSGAVIAAGAVVTHDVNPGEIVAGVPAKPIGQRQLKEFHYRLGRPRLFQ